MAKRHPPQAAISPQNPPYITCKFGVKIQICRIYEQKEHIYERKGMKAQEICENCTFFAESYGECRRHPPTVFVYEDGHQMQLVSQWPQVTRSNWCGHWLRE